MTNEELRARLEAIEKRLGALEAAQLSGDPQRHSPPPERSSAPQKIAPATHSPATHSPPAQDQTPPLAVGRTPEAARPAHEPLEVRDLAITNVLGWTGAVALVLAAAYLIRLAINAGWLTPAVQVAGAALLGLLLIGAGFGLRGVGHRYAGLLPAAGVAILFLSVYGAHLLYHIATAHEAAVALIVVCAISLGLCASFQSDLYALFAVAGSYSAPFLIEHGLGSFSDIALYYCAWSLTFTLFAIFRGRRLIYLLALYVGLVGFDALARSQLIDWRTLVEFQTAQFAIFAIGATTFSIRWRTTLDERAALFHLPALLLFYALQYVVLKAHLPQAAPWIAVGSLFAVASLYVAARLAFGRPSSGAQLLLGSYAALVLFHAGYLELLPVSSAPWVALGVVAAALLARREWSRAGAGLWPLLLAVGAMFILNLLQLWVTGAAHDRVAGHQLLGVVYAVMLYVGFYLTREEPRLQSLSAILLYAGHITAMSTTLRLVDERILQSLVWGLLALAAMAWSVAKEDRQAAQSALLVFGATAVKVMLYDLHGAAPLARVVGLFVLGIAFYAGGLLYQRLTKPQARSRLRI